MVRATKPPLGSRSKRRVARPRLVGALGEGLARGLVLVCAPAGFGKTALLADWGRWSDQFSVIMPRDYRRAMDAQRMAEANGTW